jgi:8-oxo-dGTP pyrophosphatase MutT (NUDIX family)
MEYLDYYDIDGNFLGTWTREQVHREWLWHNTVHCRLYTHDWKLLFQIRKDTGTFYTTASWHVLAWEDIRQAFHREVKEELWIDVDVSDAELVSIVPWKQDKIKADWSEYHDRAKAHVYVNEYRWNFENFDFDKDEVAGVVLVDARDTLELFKKWEWKVQSTIITDTDKVDRDVDISEFLVTKNETLLQKYWDVLDKIISIT